MKYLICFDMDRVLVDYLSTWQYVYDQLGINNDEAFSLYNQGLLNEWNWLKLDLALIKNADPLLNDEGLRNYTYGTPLMQGIDECLQKLSDKGYEIAIISGGMQETARQIASNYPSGGDWKKRWGGLNRHCVSDSSFHVFTNGWLSENGNIGDYGRYQVQMNGKGSIVQILQRRLSIPKERTISVGDSSGDIDMFKQSGFAICFNPLDDKPLSHADVVIREKNLSLVLFAIEDWVAKN